MKKKALRMQRTERHINRQIRILDIREFDHIPRVRGRFKKQNALDCGRPRCGICGNARRVHKEITFQEQKANEVTRQELRWADDEFSDL